MVSPSTAPASAAVARRAKGKRRLLPASKNFLATGMAAAALASEAVAGAPSQPDSERECHCIYGNDGVPVKAQCGALLIYLHGQAPDQLEDLRGVIADEGGKVFLDVVRETFSRWARRLIPARIGSPPSSRAWRRMAP